MRICFIRNESLLLIISFTPYLSHRRCKDNAYFYNNETFYKKICLRVISLFKIAAKKIILFP